MAKTIEQAREDLAHVVPYLRQAAVDATHRARPGARIQLAIIAKNQDGSGQIGASFDCEDFLSDLETIFPPSEDDVLQAQAACILSKVGAGTAT